MLRFILSTGLCIASLATSAMAQNVTAEDMQTSKEKMQQMMNTPEFQEQMRQAREQMQARGMDTQQLDVHINNDSLGAMMEMSECITSQVSEEDMNRMQEQATTFEKKLKRLCEEGRSDEAKAKAVAFGRKMAASREGKAIKACQEKYQDQLKDQLDKLNNQYGFYTDQSNRKDICE